MNVVSKMMNFLSKMINFALKMMYFVLTMMYFVFMNLGRFVRPVLHTELARCEFGGRERSGQFLMEES